MIFFKNKKSSLLAGIVLLCFLMPKFSLSKEDARLDSLLHLFRTKSFSVNDKINLLHTIAWEFMYINTDSAMKYALIQLSEAERSEDNTNKSEAHNTIGVIYKNAGDFDKAIDHFLIMLRLNAGLKNERAKASCYNNMGSAYYFKGNYQKALHYYLICLQIDIAEKDSAQIARVSSNIGNIYYSQKYYDKAEKYVSTALKIKTQLKTKGSSIAGTQNNLAAIYEALGDTNKALGLYNQALNNYSLDNNNQGLAATYLNLSSILMTKHVANGKLNALLDSAISLLEVLGDKENLGVAYMNKGQVFLTLKNYEKSEYYLNKALSLSKETKGLASLRDIYSTFSDLYEKKGELKKALHFHKKYMAVKDSLLNESVTQQLAEAEVKFNTSGKNREIKLLNQEKELSDLRFKEKEAVLTRKLYIEIGLGVLLVIVSAFAFFYLNENKKRRTVNHQLIRINQEIEEQRVVIERKNNDITDSIIYAKRIQDALFQEEILHSETIPPHFILFKPKDIISGDFYWSIERDSFWYVAVADCTGHGVPGAMMSMLGIAFLNEIIGTEADKTPAEILNLLQSKVSKEFGKSIQSENLKEGMDISLIRFDFKNEQIKWAGANKPLWIISSDENENITFDEIAPDKHPIGLQHKQQLFSEYTYNYKPGDNFYIFSDGYADQFGGPKGKKFKYKQLQDMIAANSKQTPLMQKEMLDTTFEKWKHGQEQVDDVCIMGIKIS